VPGLNAVIPVPDTKVAPSQIPSSYKGIPTSKRHIEGPGGKMSNEVPDAYDVYDVEDAKNIKNAQIASTSKNGTGR
jgi:hypothetical protein